MNTEIHKARGWNIIIASRQAGVSQVPEKQSRTPQGSQRKSITMGTCIN